MSGLTVAAQTRLTHEVRVLRAACLHPTRCLLPVLAMTAGLAYLFVPIDLIPDRTPYVGHLDEVFFVIAGLAAARLMLPSEPGLEAHAGEWRAGPGPSGRGLRVRLLGAIAERLHRMTLGGRPDPDARDAMVAFLRAARRGPAPAALDLFARLPQARRRVSQLLTLDLIRAGVLPAGQTDRFGMPGIVPQSGDPLAFWTGPDIAFLHFEKTAGVAVADALTRRFHPRQIDQDPHRSFPAHLRMPFPTHTAQRLRRHALLWGHCDLPAFRRLDPDRLVMTMLREPAARIVSLYRYWRSVDPRLVDADGANFPVAAAHRLDLLGFLRERDPCIVDYIDNVYARRLTGAYASHADADPLVEDPAGSLRRALEALGSVAIVGIVERPRQSLQMMSDLLETPFGETLARRNVTDAPAPGETKFRPAEQTPITPECRAELERLTRLDREIYRHACLALEAWRPGPVRRAPPV